MKNELWETRVLVPGDHIRVKREFYTHHGIYIGNGRVIHFTANDGDGMSDPDSVRVRETDMDFFLKGGRPETLRYTPIEKLKKAKDAEIVKRAMEAIGEGGYDILSNNCEHFASRCVFGKAESRQVDDMRAELKKKLEDADRKQ